MTVGDFAARWPELFPRSPATDAHNASMVRPFVKRFGRTDLERLDGLVVIGWANRHGRHARYVRTLLADAVRGKVLAANPLEGVRLRAPKPREHVQPSEGDVAELVSHADGLLGAMIATAAYTGARYGQLVDLDCRDVKTVCEPLRAAVRAQKGNPAREVAVLRPCRERLADAVTGRSGLVFVTPGGRRWSQSAFSRAWRELDVPFRFHDLRGFCASWMVDQGAGPIDVAQQLHGSTDPRTVLRYYARPDREAAMGRLEAL